MKMIKLRDDCWVASDVIAGVEVIADHICVRTKDGMHHTLKADYGKGVYATAGRLVAEINEAENKNNDD